MYRLRSTITKMEVLRCGGLVVLLLLLSRSGNLKAEDDDATKLRESINTMGISLFKQLPSGLNCFVSPLAVTTELNLLLLGAKGDTADELMNALGYTGLGLTQKQAQDAFRKFLTQLRADKGASEMDCANSIWVQSGSNVLPGYKSAVQKSFFAEEQEVNFADSSATNTINNWVSQKTNGIIGTIFDSNLDTTTKLVLASAQYFKSIWQVSFDVRKTQEEPFYVNGGQTTGKVQMMQMDGNFSYVSDIDTNSEFVEIPMDGNKLTLVVALPKEIDGISYQEQFFTAENVYRALAGMDVTQVHLRIPKFALSFAQNLNQYLQNLGIQKVFANGQADLSGVNGKQDLSLSNFTETVVIKIDEKGTLPPPTKDIPKGPASTGYDFPKVVFFTADHPFGFLIRHKPTGIILFIGRVMAP